MPLNGKYALVTGGSRGIGRGIALKLAERGSRIAIHYYQNLDAANDTLKKVRASGSDGFVLQADVTQVEEISIESGANSGRSTFWLPAHVPRSRRFLKRL